MKTNMDVHLEGGERPPWCECRNESPDLASYSYPRERKAETPHLINLRIDIKLAKSHITTCATEQATTSH